MSRQPPITTGNSSGIRAGMMVYSSDGRRLGTIVRCNDTTFQIEQGIFFPDEFVATYDEVGAVRDDEVILKHDVRELRPLDPLGPEATGVVTSEEQFERWNERAGTDGKRPGRRSA